MLYKIDTGKAGSHVRKTEPMCVYSLFVVKLIMSYVGETLINQSLGKIFTKLEAGAQIHT